MSDAKFSTSNRPTSGVASVTHPTGATAVAVLVAGAATITAHQPSTWYGWLMTGLGAALAAYGALAPKASVRGN
jgi:hypothetical protein